MSARAPAEPFTGRRGATGAGRAPARASCGALPLAILLGVALLSGCAPRLYQRSTYVLDHAELDRFTVRYGELEGCLFKHQLPVEYRIKRQRYALALRPVAAVGEAAPRLELRFEPINAQLQLRWPDLDPPPTALYAEDGERYLIDAPALGSGVLRLEVIENGGVLREERFELRRQSCRVLGTG